MSVAGSGIGIFARSFRVMCCRRVPRARWVGFLRPWRTACGQCQGTRCWVSKRAQPSRMDPAMLRRSGLSPALGGSRLGEEE